jgi:Protein of unknown function (DUF1592)/Protein of unknown function (DUF1588)/Protein of unknown function (DUF1587)/Protein of unknown function (DUF1595)/Protein of unknown function (DUF1585)
MKRAKRTPRTKHRIGLAALLLLPIAIGAACVGSVGSGTSQLLGASASSGQSPLAPAGQQAPASDAALDSESAQCGTPSPGAAPLRRLTQSEYNNTVRDLLGDTTHPADQFPPDQQIGDFTNTAVALTVPPLLAQAYQTTAEQLATTALSTHASTLVPCALTAGTDACAQSFIQTFGKQAYRRPLTTTEQGALFALYQTNSADATFSNGIQAVIEAILQSGDFLYRVEFGDASQAQGAALPLTPYEMASRISYFLWDSMPDAALFAAADANQLTTKEQVATQARRLLQSPNAQPAVQQFFQEWLTENELPTVSKDPTTYPAFTSTLHSSMQNETNAFINWVMWASDHRLPTLLTSPVSFLNSELASVYGVSGVTGTALQQVQLDPTKRSGILTQLSMMTILGKPDRSSPVLRGKFVRDELLCQPIPPPPQNLVITPPMVTPGVSTREAFVMHEAVAECKSCHTLMDPIGFGFENYDGIGQFRTVDQGQPIDATGTLTGTDVDGPFNNAIDLIKRLATSQQVSDCFATEWFRYAFGRGESTDDTCSLQSLKSAFTSNQFDIQELLVAVTQTDAFRYRPEVTP